MSQSINTNEANWEEIRNWFSKIGRVSKRFDVEKESDLKYAKTQDGIKQFKRKLLGLCGRESTKSLDQIAESLRTIGVSQTHKEAITIAQRLVDVYLIYGGNYWNNYCLVINPIKDSKEEGLYKVESCCTEKYLGV